MSDDAMQRMNATRPLRFAMRCGAVVGAAVLLLAASGCESLQKKFIRKSKKPESRPTPVVEFEDYMRTTTPIDLYRKHYTVFNYWNAELLEELAVQTPNPKRLKRDSSEALASLYELKKLLDAGVGFEPQPDAAAAASSSPDAAPAQESPDPRTQALQYADTLLRERERINSDIQSERYNPSQLDTMRRAIDFETRMIHRALFWRKVEEQLNAPAAAGAPPAPVPSVAAEPASQQAAEPSPPQASQ